MFSRFLLQFRERERGFLDVLIYKKERKRKSTLRIQSKQNYSDG